MSGMKYQIGDRVLIKSIDWYNENKDKYGTIYTSNGFCFCDDMTKHCGDIMKIIDIIVDPKDSNQGYYIMDNVKKWTDDMIEGMVNISKLGTAANPVEPKLNANCSTWEKVDVLATKIDKELPSGDQNVWELPDGYQFVDENGNVINATIIALEKKKTEYPKTYAECYSVLGYEPDEDVVSCYRGKLIESFVKLLICRDAYWKIAGEEIGLDKPWEPDWREERYIIYRNRDDIISGYREAGYVEHHIFEFPTKEMRDQFKNNFNKELEICKELL